MEDCETKPQTGQKREGKRHATDIDVPVVYVFKCSVIAWTREDFYEDAQHRRSLMPAQLSF